MGGTERAGGKEGGVGARGERVLEVLESDNVWQGMREPAGGKTGSVIDSMHR